MNNSGHSYNIKTIGKYDGAMKSIIGGSTNSAVMSNTETGKTGITINDEGTVEGTNAPYIQLLVCQKE